MVSVRMDFYQYREEVKRAILQRIARLDSKWDPFVASWLAYALSQDGFEANQPLLDLVERLDLWAGKGEAWAARRNLGALSFLGYFLNKLGKDAGDFTNRVLEQIGRLEELKDHKFSPVNDPEQVFPMALLVGFLEEVSHSLRDSLKEIARRQMQGTLKRQILYAAALRELGEVSPLPVPTGDVSDVGDAIALVWCYERYGAPDERAKWWEVFEKVKEGSSFYQDEGREESYVLSHSEISLLYEALTRETANPDPNLLFDLYPLHPRVREIAESLYKKREYKNAVEEATKALNAYIQEKTGSDKSEADLVQSVMKNFPRPTLQLTPYIASDSGMNEQAGLALIAEGTFKAFRNPKAHSPKDAPQVRLDALEALDQLVIISYIFKRVERAEVNS